MTATTFATIIGRSGRVSPYVNHRACPASSMNNAASDTSDTSPARRRPIDSTSCGTVVAMPSRTPRLEATAPGNRVSAATARATASSGTSEALSRGQERWRRSSRTTTVTVVEMKVRLPTMMAGACRISP